MNRHEDRLAQCEALADPEPPTRWHIIIQHVGQTYEEALAEYGEDRIGPTARIRVCELVEPGPDQPNYRQD